MSKIGANIWTSGDAIANAEFGVLDAGVGAANITLPVLQVAAQSLGEIPSGSAIALVNLPGLTAEGDALNRASAFTTLPVIEVAGFAGVEAAADVLLPGMQVSAFAFSPPDITIANCTLKGMQVESSSYTWVVSNTDAELPGLAVLAANYPYAGAALDLVPFYTWGSGRHVFGMMMDTLPGLRSLETVANVTVEDALTIAVTTVAADILVIIRDALQASTEFSALGARLNITASDELLVRALHQLPVVVQVLDELTVEDHVDAAVLRMLTVAETLRAEDQADAQATLLLTIASALTLRDHADNALNLTVQEALEMLAKNTASLRLNLSTADELLASVAVDDTATFVVTAESQFAAQDEFSTLAWLQATVEDRLETYVTIRVGDEVIQGWVLSTTDRAFSEYQNFPFNSLMEADGRFFAVAEDGLYELTGDTDEGEPIEALLRTGLLDMGTHFLKDAKSAYIGYTSDGKLVLKVTTVQHGVKEQWWYELKQGEAQSARGGRFTIGRGPRSRYWQFELVNMEGADFNVDEVHIMYSILNRRIR